MSNNTDRIKAFKSVLEKADKGVAKAMGTSGEISFSLLGENRAADVEFISTGSIVLDQLLGGGLPKGRVVELYGPEASGKTSIALNAVANVQREGGNAVFIDAEQALDPRYSAILGVDIDNLGFSQESVAEYVLQSIRLFLESKAVDIIVVDSIPSLIPIDTLKDPDKPSMALMARTLSKQLPILVRMARESGTTIIFLNQIRSKVGVVFGNPEDTPGGKALKFYASQRIEIRRVGQVKDGSDVIGTEVRMRVVKNKVAPPFEVGTTVLTFAQGINRPAEALTVGEELGIIEKSGRTYRVKVDGEVKLVGEIAEYEEEGLIKIATSQANAVKALTEEEDLYEYIIELVREKMRSNREGAIFEEHQELQNEVIEEFEAFDDVE